MCSSVLVLSLLCVAPLLAQNAGETPAARLRALVERAPRLALTGTPLPVQPPQAGWGLGMVSWVAAGRDGVIYLLQRGDKADPVIALDRRGRVLRSWGKGLYVMPHSIRIDPRGNVWTTDAASSKVLEFTPQGKNLTEIDVGGQPAECRNNFCGTTDVAFAPNGHIFISDGYANARVLEYTADGKKVREWGAPGTGPGQFHLPHSIQIDRKGIVYVADRENARIERFNLAGHYLGEWTNLGKPFSLTLRSGFLYVAAQPPDAPNLAPGWLVKLDPQTGKNLGYVESTGNHGLEATETGDLLIGPGPGHPLWFH
ncbi:MAG TPA: peptidyl-alpha-hydroxyglycine alpha-amidating lyase family protein [Candidatus Acidoferrales bacterium]|nr:peptidyl-alpha-hydroxyglycine alpha-amidating lyase family protein [Candidatus Acidoferrales bacterium]